MNTRTKPINILGLCSFFAGALLGMVLFGSLVWANLEADFYFGFGIKGETALNLTCPLIMTSPETGDVTATITNATNRTVEPLIQTDISSPILTTLRERVSIEAGEVKPVVWKVDAGDVAFGHLILVKVYQFNSLSLKSASATCGTLFLDFPNLTGKQIYVLALLTSLFAMIGGVLLRVLGIRPIDGRVAEEMKGMILLTVVVCIGILFGSLGWWMPGVFVMAISLLLTAILIGRRITAS
jgi:hypothetical protein